MNDQGTFQQIISQYIIEDPRYPVEAYYFLRSAFDDTQRKFEEESREKGDADAPRSLSASELTQGFLDYAIFQFGPMAAFVMREWGIITTSDIGNLVYNLIEMKIFSENEGDKKSDFDNLFDLEAELKKAYEQ